MDIMAMLTKLLTKNGLIFAFVIIGITNFIAYKFPDSPRDVFMAVQ